MSTKYFYYCLFVLSTWQTSFASDTYQKVHRIPGFFDPLVLNEKELLLDLGYAFNKAYSSLNYGLTKEFTLGVDFINISKFFLREGLDLYLKGRYRFLNHDYIMSSISTYYNLSTSKSYTFYNFLGTSSWSLRIFRAFYLDALVGYAYIDNQYEKDSNVNSRKSVFESLFLSIGLKSQIGSRSTLKLYLCTPFFYQFNIELPDQSVQERAYFQNEEFLIKADLSYALFSEKSLLILGFIYTNQLGLINYLEPGSMNLKKLNNKIDKIIYKNSFYPTLSLSLFL